jgi:hypothetical protein
MTETGSNLRAVGSGKKEMVMSKPLIGVTAIMMFKTDLPDF